MSCQDFEHLFAADQRSRSQCWAFGPNSIFHSFKGLTGQSSSFFVAPRCPSRAISKNALSFFLREVIQDSGAVLPSAGPVRAHSIHGVATSVSFLRNWAVSKVLEAATWKSNSVFASFYLYDISCVFEGLQSLGPFAAAGQVVAPR